MVILHCLAHIKVGDFKDDGNPVFLRQFYKVSLIATVAMSFAAFCPIMCAYVFQGEGQAVCMNTYILSLFC